MIQQRKIIRYKGAVLKIVPSGPNYMEWRALLPNGQRLHDPTSCGYSIKFMKFWLRYGKDDVHDYFVYQNREKAQLDTVSFWAPWRPSAVNRFTNEERLVRARLLVRGKIRLGEYTKRSRASQNRPWFNVSYETWSKKLGWAAEKAAHPVAILPPYKQEEENGSSSSGEAELQA